MCAEGMVCMKGMCGGRKAWWWWWQVWQRKQPPSLPFVAEAMAGMPCHGGKRYKAMQLNCARCQRTAARRQALFSFLLRLGRGIQAGSVQENTELTAFI